MERGLAPSRAAARRLIIDGGVEVAGIPQPRPATLVDAGAAIRCPSPLRYVGRGGDKLAGALDDFGVDATGAHCLDVGAAVGGFTDCLLQRGAATVVAVDVGYGQLAWELRSDERVRVVERTNFRHAAPAELGAPFDVVVADVSFISLVTLGGALSGAGGPDAGWILLVKPQFEVGKGEVGRRGIVTSPDLHAAALRSVVSGLARHGLRARGVAPSRLRGAKGNKEFFLWLTRSGSTIGDEMIEAAVR